MADGTFRFTAAAHLAQSCVRIFERTQAKSIHHCVKFRVREWQTGGISDCQRDLLPRGN